MERYRHRNENIGRNPFPIATLSNNDTHVRQTRARIRLALVRGQRLTALANGRVFEDPKRSIKYFIFNAPNSCIELLDLKIPSFRSHVLKAEV